MKKSLVSLGAFFITLTHLAAAPSLDLNDRKELVISASDGTPITTLVTGSIGKQINAENQLFKVSYGKDLRGRTNIIIYPDPEKPQSLDLMVMKQSVQISSDAVLTIIDDGTGSLSQFQAGVVGQVTVAGQPLASGAAVKVSQGTVTPLAANTSAFPEPAPTPENRSDQAGAPAQEPVQTATYEGPMVQVVEGEVLYAPPGKDIMEMIKTSAQMPVAQSEQRLPSGSSLQTGPNGKAMISPFPGCVIAVQPNSTVILEDAQYQKSNGDYQRKMHVNVKEGGVISIIKGINPDSLDYQVKSPLGVAAARGTIFGTWGDITKLLIIAKESNLSVTYGKPPVNIILEEGKKLLVTAGGGPAQEFEITPEESQAFITLVNSIQNLLSANIKATGDSTGGGGGSGGTLDEQIQQLREDLRNHQPRLNDLLMTPFTSTI